MRRGSYHFVTWFALLLLTQPASAALEQLQLDAPSSSKTTPTLHAKAIADEFVVDSQAIAMPHSQTEKLVRLDSNFTSVLGGSSARLRIGDGVSNAGVWGNAVRFGGVQFSTALTGVASATPMNSTCADYSLGVGNTRRDFGVVSNRYGSLFASGTITCAVSPSLKMEFHGEHVDGQATTAGMGLIQSMGSIGTAAVAVATSRYSEGSGWQARFKFEHNGDLLQVKLRARVHSVDFRDSTSPTNLFISYPQSVLPEHNVMASVGTHFWSGNSLALSYSDENIKTTQDSGVVALNQQFNLSHQRFLSLAAGKSIANSGANIQVAYSQRLLH